MHQANVSRRKNQALNELEEEARDRAQYLLEKANAMRMEQEDEVKRLNEVTAATPPAQQTHILTQPLGSRPNEDPDIR